MSKFVDKNALFKIVMKVRNEDISDKQGIKQIFNLLLSLHGSVGVINGELIYNPDYYAYVDYMERSSSIITITEGTAESRSMRLATLEEAQNWEIRVGEQICLSINRALSKYEIEDRMLLLEQSINGGTIETIKAKYHIGVRRLYETTNKIRASLMTEFSLFSGKENEKYLNTILEYINVSNETPLKRICQENLAYDLELMDWEKQL